MYDVIFSKDKTCECGKEKKNWHEKCVLCHEILLINKEKQCIETAQKYWSNISEFIKTKGDQVKKLHIVGIFALVFLVLSGWVFGKGLNLYADIYNQIVASRQAVNKSVSDLDTEYQLRYALVDNLVKIVKDTKSFEKYLVEVEKDIYVKTAQAKASATKMDISVPDTMKEKIQSENDLGHMLTNAMDKLMVMAQQYPQISDPKVKDREKSFEALKQLNIDLKNIEADILYARKMINERTRIYNQTIQSFPANIVAGHAKELPYFQVVDQDARKDVSISL